MGYNSYPMLFDTWSETSSRMFNSIMEANRAALTAFGVPNPGSGSTSGPESTSGTGGNSDTGTSTGTDAGDARLEDHLEPAADLPEWETEVDAEGELTVGDSVQFSKTLSAADVDRFAAASGDTNPIHLDDEWAEETRFNGRIVHGTLAAGLISAALARLPGGVVYLSQDLEFRAPVRLGDRIAAEVEVVEDLGGDRYRLRTTVSKGEELVIDGEAVVLIDDVPDS